MIELEPFYAQVEREIGVSGQAGNINGELIEGGNPFEAPRSGPYPFPPIRPSAANQPFVDACNALGYHPFPVPTSIISEDWGERKACVYCGFCRDYGCHVGAKSSTQDALIPAAMATRQSRDPGQLPRAAGERRSRRARSLGDATSMPG